MIAVIFTAKALPTATEAAAMTAATGALADQPMPYTVAPTQKVRAACDLDSIKNVDGLATGEIVYNYRQCFQKAGYDFDKSILHFAVDYGKNP